MRISDWVQTCALPNSATHRAGSISQNEGRQASAAPVVVEKMPRLAPQTDEYSPCARELSTFGGVELNAFSTHGSRSEERCVGRECVSTCRTRLRQYNENKKENYSNVKSSQ